MPDNICVDWVGAMSIELRGIELRHDGMDKIVSAIVQVDYPENYEKHELFRNKAVNRGRILTALGAIYGIDPGQIVWPRHIKAKDF